MGKFSNAALRITAGALILDAGVKKLKADEGTYAFLQQMAQPAYPQSPSWTQQPSVSSSPATETALGATPA